MRFGSLLLTASTAVLAVAAPSTEKKKRVSKFQWFGKKHFYKGSRSNYPYQSL